MGFSAARLWLFSSKVPHILATMVTTATGKQMTNEETKKTHFYVHRLWKPIVWYFMLIISAQRSSDIRRNDYGSQMEYDMRESNSGLLVLTLAWWRKLQNNRVIIQISHILKASCMLLILWYYCPTTVELKTWAGIPPHPYRPPPS
jgi:hypothetical protein